jgi:hypothetical protein
MFFPSEDAILSSSTSRSNHNGDGGATRPKSKRPRSETQPTKSMCQPSTPLQQEQDPDRSASKRNYAQHDRRSHRIGFDGSITSTPVIREEASDDDEISSTEKPLTPSYNGDRELQLSTTFDNSRRALHVRKVDYTENSMSQNTKDSTVETKSKKKEKASTKTHASPPQSAILPTEELLSSLIFSGEKGETNMHYYGRAEETMVGSAGTNGERVTKKKSKRPKKSQSQKDKLQNYTPTSVAAPVAELPLTKDSEREYQPLEKRIDQRTKGSKAASQAAASERPNPGDFDALNETREKRTTTLSSSAHAVLEKYKEKPPPQTSQERQPTLTASRTPSARFQNKKQLESIAKKMDGESSSQMEMASRQQHIDLDEASHDKATKEANLDAKNVTKEEIVEEKQKSAKEDRNSEYAKVKKKTKNAPKVQPFLKSKVFLVTAALFVSLLFAIIVTALSRNRNNDDSNEDAKALNDSSLRDTEFSASPTQLFPARDVFFSASPTQSPTIILVEPSNAVCSGAIALVVGAEPISGFYDKSLYHMEVETFNGRPPIDAFLREKGLWYKISGTDSLLEVHLCNENAFGIEMSILEGGRGAECPDFDYGDSFLSAILISGIVPGNSCTTGAQNAPLPNLFTLFTERRIDYHIVVQGILSSPVGSIEISVTTEAVGSGRGGRFLSHT